MPLMPFMPLPLWCFPAASLAAPFSAALPVAPNPQLLASFPLAANTSALTSEGNSIRGGVAKPIKKAAATGDGGGGGKRRRNSIKLEL